MRVLGVLILLGLSGFFSYKIWCSSKDTTKEPIRINQEYIASAEEVIIWRPLESALNPAEIPHWEKVSKSNNAFTILEKINASLSSLSFNEPLEVRILMKSGECNFYISGNEEELKLLMLDYFNISELNPEVKVTLGSEVGIYYGGVMILSSSSSAQDELLALSEEKPEMKSVLEQDSELSWYARNNIKRWMSFNEINAEGSGLIRFKKRKGFVYAFTFVEDSLMKEESLDVTYSIWDFQLPGSANSFTIEQFPIRTLDKQIVSDVEEICQCDVRTAWKSWNSNQIYLFRQQNIEFYGLQCLTGLPAQTGLYPFIADAAEMYKGYQLKSLISGSEVGGLYADMFGREVSHYLDLEEQVFFFSSKKEAKTFINGIQNNDFSYLVDENLRELLLLSPSFTSFNSSATANEPVVYQYEKQDRGRYYHALWKSEDQPEFLATESSPDENLTEGFMAPKNMWEKQLSGMVEGAPFVFTNHYTKAKEVAVFSADNKLTLLDSRGKVLWERQLDEKLIGELHQVDLFRNNKFQIVFSTKNQLYAIDRNGKNVENFPINFPSESSAAVSVMDYEGNRKYRFLIPLKDGRLLNYSKDGKPVNGWKHKKESSPIISQVHHAQVGRKDYLICAKKDNKIAIYKRDGKPRYTQDLKLSNYNGGPISMLLSKDIENVKLVYQDLNNNIVRVKLSLDNNAAEIVAVASGDHALIAQLVDGSAPDYLVSKGSRLSLFNEKDESKFTVDFEDPIHSELQYFKKGKSVIIGVSSGSSFYLVNLRGETLNGFPIYGRGKALFADLKSDGKYELILADEQGLLICYELSGL